MFLTAQEDLLRILGLANSKLTATQQDSRMCFTGIYRPLNYKPLIALRVTNIRDKPNFTV